MKYRELYDEYADLLTRETVLRQEMHGIPKGYLVTKKIADKEYLYLQYTAQGKKKSEYVREEDQTRIRTAVARREPAKEELNALHREQTRLERAAQILDGNLYRTFVFLRQCAEMDALPMEKRRDALAFARAMTALEGLAAREETEQNLLLWARGEKKFAHFYMKFLQSYRSEELKIAEGDLTRMSMGIVYAREYEKFHTETLRDIHRTIFGGLYEWAGEFRTIPIMKAEEVLGGDTVRYAAPSEIKKQLDMTSREIARIKPTADKKEIVFKIVRITAAIWQTHPFREGNTRSVVAFSVLLASKLGVKLDYELFASHAAYVRNALVW